MASPFQLGSSGSPDPDPAAGTPGRSRGPFVFPGASSRSFYTHPSRTAALGSAGGLGLDSPPGFTLARPDEALDMDDSPNGNSAPGPLSESWRRTGALPSFSRAFDMFTAPDGMDDSDQELDYGFFVPSYLEGSTYVQKLEEAHKTKLQAQRESRRAAGSGISSSPAGFNQPSLPPGSHRGMAHTVIERPPAFEEEDSLAPLPTRWNKDDIRNGVEIQADGMSIKYTGPKNHHERDHEACAVRSDNYIPAQCGVYYYEVQILSSKRDDSNIAIGFSTKAATLSRPVGWEPESWGYHSDDGRCFTAQNIGRPYGPQFITGDIIGCGINFRDNKAFYTKNGDNLGTAFSDISRGKLYPSISLKKPGEFIRVNFGQTPFVYNIDDLMEEQREEVRQKIESTSTSQLERGLSETDLVQTLVLQFLQHDGYVETARAFADDMKVQKEALNLDPSVKVDGINIKDDEDANNRQRIRRAVLEGDIDRALKFTNVYYPHVLRDNEQVYFKLRCRKFIEMVRKAAQLNMASDSKRSNGHASDSGVQEMDLDLNGNDRLVWAESMETDGIESYPELVELERTMLEYGQSLQAEYATDPRREVAKTLDEIWALVAYRNPLKEPEVSHLLDRKGRVAVAEELNSAILLSLGKSSRASLEKLLAQTTVLLEDLRQDGGDGAFVSIQDVVDEIPRSSQI